MTRPVVGCSGRRRFGLCTHCHRHSPKAVPALPSLAGTAAHSPPLGSCPSIAACKQIRLVHVRTSYGIHTNDVYILYVHNVFCMNQMPLWLEFCQENDRRDCCWDLPGVVTGERTCLQPFCACQASSDLSCWHSCPLNILGRLSISFNHHAHATCQKNGCVGSIGSSSVKWLCRKHRKQVCERHAQTRIRSRTL